MMRRLFAGVGRRSPAVALPPAVPPAPAADNRPPPEARQTAIDFDAILRLVDERGHPNINPLWRITKDLEAARLNTKLLGYQLAQSFEHRLQAIPLQKPASALLDSRAVTQADIESRWFRFWCERLKERPRYHRKLWEFAYVMQALHAADVMRSDARVLGVGESQQPFSSYLARQGANITQLVPLSGEGQDWRSDPLYSEAFVDLPTFRKRFQRRGAALPSVPDDLNGFDAVFSIGAMAHQGSIAAAMSLVRRLMETLKPGGVAVHIFEYNYADPKRTLDDWPVVLFQSWHLSQLAKALEEDGHHVSPLDLSVGFDVLDRFVDLPPYEIDRTSAFEALWRDGWQAAHLKAMIDGFAVTSFGLIVECAGADGGRRGAKLGERPGRNHLVDQARPEAAS